MTSAPIVLVPGFWLGAWAWDEVAAVLLPTTLICTGFTSEQVKVYAKEHNPAWLGGLAELRDVTRLDLPTSHWPM